MKFIKSLSMVLGFSLLFAGAAYAGADGAEFDAIWQTLVGWTQGTLGRVMALAMIVTGLGMGVVRQSIAAVVVGVACGLALYNAPTVIEQVVGAVL